MTFLTIQAEHYPAVARIYEEGILTGHATFQTTSEAWENWNQSHLSHSRIAAFEGSEMLGWAALSPVSSRCVYGGVAEVSVYVSAAARGQGVGEALLRAMIQESEKNGIWMLQSGVFPENKSSIRIHEKVGFRIVGYRERIGKMGDWWRDNLLLERRSSLVGI
jgi:L-amino acid N-acyltransferase YncA